MSNYAKELEERVEHLEKEIVRYSGVIEYTKGLKSIIKKEFMDLDPNNLNPNLSLGDFLKKLSGDIEDILRNFGFDDAE
jgi:hypothetical protein